MKFRWKNITRGLFSTCQVCFNENSTKTQSLRRGMPSIHGTTLSPLLLLPRRALMLLKNQGYAPGAPNRSLGSRQGISQRTANSRGTAPGCAARHHGTGGEKSRAPGTKLLTRRQPRRFGFSLTQNQVLPLHLPPRTTAVV